MRAVRLTQLGKPLENADVPVPEIGPTEVLIRVAAAGICHSDAHYRAGISKIDRLPLTLGHEVAGRVEEVGSDVTHLSAGDRVCVHYLVHCGSCEFCVRGLEQFCRSGQMIGKHRDGGYAEFIKVPGANAFPLPDEIPFEVGAIMMCSSATALHALKKARFKAGESIAIFGFGGLGFSALQLARAFDCEDVYVVEINPAKLASAAQHGSYRDRRQIRRSGRANQRGNRWNRSRCRTRIDRLCKNHAPGRALLGPSRTRRLFSD